MGELSFWENIWWNIRDFIGGFGFKLFIWSIRISEDEYLFNQWYSGVNDGLEKATNWIYGDPLYSDNSQVILCGLKEKFRRIAKTEWEQNEQL